MTTKSKLLVVNNVLHSMKRFDDTWSDEMQERLTMITAMRNSYDHMWYTEEYKEQAARLVERWWQHLEDDDFEATESDLQDLAELYTMNKLYQGLDNENDLDK